MIKCKTLNIMFLKLEHLYLRLITNSQVLISISYALKRQLHYEGKI